MMVRASDLLGRRAVSAGGRDLGRVVDLVTETDGSGRQEVVAAVAVRGPWGRLLGYEREQVRGPWILETLARWIMRRQMTTIPYSDLHLADPASE
jgi:sporulation protein YlmC with PRC-barrel domain